MISQPLFFRFSNPRTCYLETANSLRKIFIFVVFIGVALGSTGFSATARAVDLVAGDIVAVDPNNQSIVKVDPATGVVELIAVVSLGSPQYIAVDGNGNLIVTTAGEPGVVRIDPVTGIETTIVSGEPPFCGDPAGVAVEADGNILVADPCDHRVFRIDPVTGSETILAQGLPMNDPFGIALEADGSIVVSNENAGVVRVDPLTGAQTIVTEECPELCFPSGIAVESDGNILVTDRFFDSIVRVDPTTGAQTLLVDLGGDDPEDVAVEETGDILVSIDSFPEDIVRVDPITGASTVVTSDLDSGAIGIAVVPQLGPKLTISGTCPGVLSVDVSGLSPGALVALARGTAPGPFTVPSGFCAGTEVGLADPTLVTTLFADDGGALMLSPTASAAACGLFIQALDLVTCTPTNVTTLP